tara:strand:- start:190 stop:672 length:483 start_codon:yes stop_codon:yes gene_type:complete
MNDKRYRKNVGLIVLNENNKLLICKRKDKSAWQFPQGGIDKGEKNLDAAYRELFEEVGISRCQVNVIARSKYWYYYEIPKGYKPRPKSLKNFCGQKQKWYLLKAKDELKINLTNQIPQEFIDYRWSSYWFALKHVVPFKREVYRNVLNEFLPKYISLYDN